MTEKHQPSKKSTRETKLPFFEEDLYRNFDIDKITAKDFLRFFDLTNFETYFDREKIQDFLKRAVGIFEKDIYGKVFCSKCKSDQTEKVCDKEGIFTGYFRCARCKAKFKPKPFISSRFNNRTIGLIFANLAEGKTPRGTYPSLVTERTSILVNYGVLEALPDEKTLYDILEKSAKKFSDFMEIMVIFLGGVEVEVLYIDDAFAKKKRAKNHQSDYRNQAVQRRFAYAIVSMAKESRFIVCLHIAKFRSKNAFREAYGITERRIKMSKLKELKGDKLRVQVSAAPYFFPRDHVKYTFRALKPWQKKDLMIIERKIESMRKTLPKHKKSGSLDVLMNLAVLAMVYLNYICPMDEALDGKSPAQAAGILYPFLPYDWSMFMIWLEWFFGHFSEILKTGLKQIPGSTLKPCSDISESLFNQRRKQRR